MKKLILALTVLVGMSSAANAGVLIEPYLGYGLTTVKYETVGSSTSYTDNLSGLGFGARLGYKFLLPWVALDYLSYSGSASPGDSSVPKYDYTGSALGLVVGADLPMGLRLFGGYGFSDQLTQKGTSGSADRILKGSYTKVGLGYKIVPMLFSLNAEYIMHKFTKADVGGGSVDADSVFSSLDVNTVLISLSMPFNL